MVFCDLCAMSHAIDAFARRRCILLVSYMPLAAPWLAACKTLASKRRASGARMRHLAPVSKERDAGKQKNTSKDSHTR